MAVRMPTLVGRRQEIDLVRATLAGPGGRAVVLGGQAGVGKTRLVREVARAWEAGGQEVEWVDGAAGRSAIPFGAVARLLPENGVTTPELVPRDAELVRAAVAGARRRGDRLIAVDDGHELDELSALLIHHLVLDGAVPVVITVRSGEATPDVLASLWRNGHAQRIDLLPLSEAESRELVAGVLGGAVEPETAEALCRLGAGNPLLLGELIRDSTESGHLRTDPAGRWHWDGSLGRAHHLQEAIGNRLHHLDDELRRLLILLALGEPLAAEVVQRMVPDVDLAEAEDRSLVRVRAGRTGVEVRLGHPLLGEVVRGQAAPEAVRSLRLELADELAVAGERRGPNGRLEARLRLDAGDTGDPEHLLWAAHDAVLMGSPDGGRSLAEAAIAGGAAHRAHIVLAEAHLLAGDDAEAERLVEAVLPTLDADVDRVRAAQVLQHLHHRSGNLGAIEEVSARVAARVEDPVWRAIVEGTGLQMAMMSGHTRDAWERAEVMLAEHDDPRVRLRLVSTVGSGRALGGRTADSLELASVMMSDALRLQEELPLAPAWVANANCIGLLLAGRLDDALGFVAMLRALEAAQSGSLPAEEPSPWLALFTGRIELARGDASGAARLLGAAADGLGPDDLGGFYPWARSLQAEALALTGSLEAAQTAAAEAVARPSRMRIYDGEARRARAWVTAQGGELSKAVSDLLSLAAEQRAEAQHALEIYTLHDAVRLGAGSRAIEPLRTALASVDGLWAGAQRAHLDALDSGLGTDLEHAAEQFAAMGANLHAAEVLAAAARSYEAEALRSRAAAAARRRDELLDTCGEARTPALQDLVAVQPLTRREREVVALAAQGLSNREIAERLFVSLRTAEGHLLRAFGKLGVTDRAALPDALARARARR